MLFTIGTMRNYLLEHHQEVWSWRVEGIRARRSDGHETKCELVIVMPEYSDIQVNPWS